MSLTKFRFFCQHVLPLVYDDSLSYYEVLCKLTSKLNETIEQVNTLEDTMSDIQTAFDELAQTVSDLNDLYTTFETTINNRFSALETELTDEINTAVTELSDAVDAKLDDIENRVTVLENLVDTKITELENTINVKFATLSAQLQSELQDAIDVFEATIEVNYQKTIDYVDRKIQEVIDMIPSLQDVHLFDYYSGQLVELQTAWYNMFNATRVHALSVHDFEHLGLTCGELDSYLVEHLPRGLTVLEWEYKAKILIGLEREKMLHPLTGDEVLVQDVIQFNTDNLKFAGSYSASEFDGVGISAGEFDNLGLTAWQDDWRSNTMIVVA